MWFLITPEIWEQSGEGYIVWGSKPRKAEQRPNSWTQLGKKSFLLSIQSHLYIFALRLIFHQTHATTYSFQSALLYTVKERGGKPDRKPHPLSLWFKKSIQKPQV
jgi:hypothetical protein